jgi:hypothetical protein
MPGGGRRTAQMNVYTGLLFLGVVALAAACVFMYMGASRLSPDGSPFSLHDAKSIKFAK